MLTINSSIVPRLNKKGSRTVFSHGFDDNTNIFPFFREYLASGNLTVARRIRNTVTSNEAIDIKIYKRGTCEKNEMFYSVYKLTEVGNVE